MDDAFHITSLPDDPAALKSVIAALSRQRDEASRRCDEREARLAALQRERDELQTQRDAIKTQRDELHIEKLRLEMELLRLKKWHYGPRADHLQHYSDAAQMLLEFAGELEALPLDAADLAPGTDAGDASAASVESKSVRRVRKGRRNLASFENLPVTRRTYDLSEDQKSCPCCGNAKEQIGQESSWQIEYIPARFERIEHVQIKYACRHCEQNAVNPGIELAEKPVQPIEKGMAGPGLLAYVVTSKYADYLPLYRLEGIFARNGFEIDRATQSVWCADVAGIVRPLYELMIRRVLQSHVIGTDDTIMPMLAPGKTKQARMWTYVGDHYNPYNIFDFTLGRGRDGPMIFLKGYKQILVADAYGGYDGVVVGNDITRAGCWAHGRRKFVDAEKSEPAIAAEAVGLVKRLYAVEERGRELDAPSRLALRQAESAPILSILKDKLFGWRDRLLPKHPMAQAINYTLNQWTELNVFVSDGAVPIDNNISEREMKRVVLNRKNSLFVGNERGGRTAAILSSLASTCRRHNIDPQRYLTQLLTNLPATPMSQIEQWLPDRWKLNQATHAE